ncbi:cytosolic phospholipase A2 zeta-like [Amblyraja radiata]|uniref:cytosolic phospholipase A2 zeta-like n=1 Tax=Amblyraja radiata TaxID=386614 RepID=UPI0014028873|nr:cytosolic phospholipase A2 zeta-like [Amblyraja radiata]
MLKNEQQPYYNLTVKVLQGRNIVMEDFMSAKDCYVSLHLPTASVVDYRTKSINDLQWNETFNYKIQGIIKNVLELSIYTENVKMTKHLSSVAFDIGKIELNHSMNTTIDLKDDQQLQVEFRLEKSDDPPNEIITNGVIVAQPCTCVQTNVRNANNVHVAGTGVNIQYNVLMNVDGSVEQEQVTTRKPLANPVWNERCSFHINSNLDPQLKIDLIQSSTELQEDMSVEMSKETYVVGSGSVPLRQLPLGKNRGVSLPLGQEQTVDLQLKAQKCFEDLDVRLSFDIAEPEKEFLAKRKKLVARALAKVLKLTKIPKSSQAPIIAILGSGGGMRAMTSLYGILLGLQELQLLNCITYIFGVSGSAWCISHLYQDSEWSLKDIREAIKRIKPHVTRSKSFALSKDRVGYYINALAERNRSGYSVSIPDLWGLIIESFIYGKENKTKLSDQQRAVRRGQNPYPVYASLNVKSNVSAKDFGEWFEYTPYEVGIPRYGAYIPVQHFGSKFFMGYLIKKFPETRISFLNGQWGSAFAANLDEVLRELIGPTNTWMRSLRDAISGREIPSDSPEIHMQMTIPQGMLDALMKNLFVSRLTTSETNNFMKGLFLHQKYDENDNFKCREVQSRTISPNQLTPMENLLHLVDAGFSNNSAFPLALQSQRHIDVILSFSFSRGSPFKVLKKTEQYCMENNIPFPKIDVTDLLERSLQECYIFKDENNPKVPIVIHFPLTNATFRNYVSPGTERLSNEEKDYGSFVLEAENSPYNTLNFTYTATDFDRLIDLCGYNVMNNKNLILMVFKEALAKRY